MGGSRKHLLDTLLPVPQGTRNRGVLVEMESGRVTFRGDNPAVPNRYTLFWSGDEGQTEEPPDCKLDSGAPGKYSFE